MKVGIVVLSWNSKELIGQCLTGLYRYEPNSMVYVVDNASRDDSCSYITANFPQVNLIRAPLNLGFSDGNNLGIQQALTDGCEAVFLLNNDTIIDEAFIGDAVKVAESKPEIGIVGPVIVEGESPEEIQCAGGQIRLWTARFDYHEQGSKYVKQERVVSVGYILGAAMLIKREVIEKIGYLDQEYYPAYVEEADFCYRAKVAGFRSVVSYGSRVRHLGGKSSGDKGTEFRRMMVHRFLFAVRHLNPAQFMIASVDICLRVFIRKFMRKS